MQAAPALCSRTRQDPGWRTSLAVSTGWEQCRLLRSGELGHHITQPLGGADLHLQALEHGAVQLGGDSLGSRDCGGELLGVPCYDHALCAPHLHRQVRIGWIRQLCWCRALMHWLDAALQQSCAHLGVCLPLQRSLWGADAAGPCMHVDEPWKQGQSRQALFAVHSPGV